MFKAVRAILISLFCVSGLSGCLTSPLFDHVSATDRGHDGERSSPGCNFRFDSKGICASLTWVKEPTTEETGEFTLRFWKIQEGTEHGPYRDPSPSVEVKLWMPAMDHGSSPVEVRRDAEGVFSASEVFFIMPGGWQIRINLKQGSSILDQAVMDVQI